jgi:hypothetical protein
MKATLVLHTVLLATVLGLASDPPRTFVSTEFGFSYKYPAQLIRNTAGFQKRLLPHSAWQRNLVVLFSAFERPSFPKAREGVVISADDTSYYGGLRTGKDYLPKVRAAMLRQGWIVSKLDYPVDLDGQQFCRADFMRKGKVPIYQSSVCTVRRGYALNFILAGGSEQEIDQLFGSLASIHFQRRDRHP